MDAHHWLKADMYSGSVNEWRKSSSAALRRERVYIEGEEISAHKSMLPNSASAEWPSIPGQDVGDHGNDPHICPDIPNTTECHSTQLINIQGNVS
jgi:hypothetical protein